MQLTGCQTHSAHLLSNESCSEQSKKHGCRDTHTHTHPVQQIQIIQLMLLRPDGVRKMQLAVQHADCQAYHAQSFLINLCAKCSSQDAKHIHLPGYQINQAQSNLTNMAAGTHTHPVQQIQCHSTLMAFAKCSSHASCQTNSAHRLSNKACSKQTKKFARRNHMPCTANPNHSVNDTPLHCRLRNAGHKLPNKFSALGVKQIMLKVVK